MRRRRQSEETFQPTKLVPWFPSVSDEIEQMSFSFWEASNFSRTKVTNFLICMEKNYKHFRERSRSSPAPVARLIKRKKTRKTTRRGKMSDDRTIISIIPSSLVLFFFSQKENFLLVNKRKSKEEERKIDLFLCWLVMSAAIEIDWLTWLTDWNNAGMVWAAQQQRSGDLIIRRLHALDCDIFHGRCRNVWKKNTETLSRAFGD